MNYTILADKVASISELKKHPMDVVNSTEGVPIAILSRNKPVFYCVPSKFYETLMERLDDVYLAKVITARAHEKEIEVNIDDL